MGKKKVLASSSTAATPQPTDPSESLPSRRRSSSGKHKRKESKKSKKKSKKESKKESMKDSKKRESKSKKGKGKGKGKKKGKAKVKAKAKSKRDKSKKIKSKEKAKKKSKKEESSAYSIPDADSDGVIPVTKRKLNIPRVYSQVLTKRRREDLDVTKYDVEWSSGAQYKVRLHRVIGEGSFGSVCLASNKETNEVLAVKILKKEKIKSIQNEVFMLNFAKGGPNIVTLVDTVKLTKKNNKIDGKALIFEYVENAGFKDGPDFALLDNASKRHYLYESLVALDYLHSIGMIHRDFKSGNIVYHQASGVVRLIDFGFCEFYFPDEVRPRFPGTKAWKAPEMFLRYPRYDYAVDMWSYGCLLGLLLFNSYVFHMAENSNQAQMTSIIELLGTRDLAACVNKYGMGLQHPNKRRDRELDLEYVLLSERSARTKFSRLAKRLDTPPEDFKLGLDLLDKLLVYDHETRYTAKEALMHPFFIECRENAAEERSDE